MIRRFDYKIKLINVEDFYCKTLFIYYLYLFICINSHAYAICKFKDICI